MDCGQVVPVWFTHTSPRSDWSRPHGTNQRCPSSAAAISVGKVVPPAPPVPAAPPAPLAASAGAASTAPAPPSDPWPASWGPVAPSAPALLLPLPPPLPPETSTRFIGARFPQPAS